MLDSLTASNIEREREREGEGEGEGEVQFALGCAAVAHRFKQEENHPSANFFDHNFHLYTGSV